MPTARSLAAPAAAVLLLATPAAARDVAGVQLPEAQALNGRVLRLNGAGLRRKLVFDVYVGALYLETPSADPDAILAADAPWLVSMHFLRDVDHEKILDAFRQAFDANSPGSLEALREDLMRFHDEVLSDVTLHRGDELRVAYDPEGGTVLTGPSGATSCVQGKPFADALLRSWLGPHPSDRRLKEAMLGR